MKKAFLTTVSLVALGMAPAFAADLPARTYTKAPVAVGRSITGPGSISAPWAAMPRKTQPSLPSGGFAGGTIGYNWQTGAMVFGLEADAAWSDMSPPL